MSKLRVAITTADRQAVGYYRVRKPAEILHEQGDAEVVFLDELEMGGKVVNGERRITWVKVPEADVLVLQRPTNRFIADSIPFFQRQGVAVVVDLDDDLEHTADKHAQHKLYDPRLSPDENWRHLKRACASADMVVVSTPALARYASHARCVVVRNYVPASYLGVDRDDDGLTVGWGGTVLNHPDDLPVTYGGVARAIREVPGAHFLVVGDGDRVQEQLSLDERPQSTGLVSIEDYPRQVARLTAGIAPLEKSAFNEAKSWLKLLEMSALGVIWVASSNTSEYRLFRRLGFKGALVPDRGRSWRRAVLDYLTCESLRAEHASANRLLAEDFFTLERNVWLHAEAWAGAVENRRRGK